MVARRLIPLVVAFALGFAPVALAVCRASCESAAPAAHLHHHHHHGASAPASTPLSAPLFAGAVPAMQAQPCEHGEELPAVAAALHTLAAPAVLVVPHLASPDIHARTLDAWDSGMSPPSERSSLSTQLRV